MDAFDKLADEYPNINLHIAGECYSDSWMSKSKTKSKFTKKLAELKFKYANRIKYYGVVKNVEKSELFSKCDILLFPTFYTSESFGLVIVEAMKAEMAVISTKHNFISTIVGEKEGILVEPNNLQSLIDGMKLLLNDKTLMRSMQLNNVIKAENYSPKKFLNEIMEILQ